MLAVRYTKLKEITKKRKRIYIKPLKIMRRWRKLGKFWSKDLSACVAGFYSFIKRYSNIANSTM